MRSTRRRGAAVLIALAVLLTMTAAPVTALTVQRRWTAYMLTGGSSGVIRAVAYTNRTGSIQYGLKSLRKSATYSVQIRYGTCSSLGSVALRLPAVKTSTTGTVSRTASISYGDMYWFWKAARKSSFVVRIVSGTSVRCGGFSFIRATRVSVSSVGIDLPVIRGPSTYPPCNVAMYSATVAQPREPGITFIFAHARRGMFLPLLTRWKIDRGASLIGKTVRVWTSDSVVSSYRITRVRVTTNAMAGVTSLTSERLWLQTSTGPNTTYPKLIVEAARYSSVRSTYASAHPTPHPIRC